MGKSAGFCKEDKEENYVNPDPIGLGNMKNKLIGVSKKLNR